MNNQNPVNNHPQNPANNNPPFEEFLDNLHSLNDEELQSIYGGIGVNANVGPVRVGVSSWTSESGS